MRTAATKPDRLAAARTIAAEQATALTRLDLIIARLATWIDANPRHAHLARNPMRELRTLRDAFAVADDLPLATLGPGGDFTREILADDGRLGGAF